MKFVNTLNWYASFDKITRLGYRLSNLELPRTVLNRKDRCTAPSRVRHNRTIPPTAIGQLTFAMEG